MNTEKIQLPAEGQSIMIPLGKNDNGALKMKVANWKNTRYYFTYYYKTKYNAKSANAGWITCDGEDWNGLDSFGHAEIHELFEQIKTQV